MYILSAEAEFDSAHFLSGYDGKCSNIHGHRWKTVVEIQGEKLNTEGQLRGMLTDFGDLKKDVKALADSLDHAFIIETGTLKTELLEMLKKRFRIIEFPFRPTAENFAEYVYNEMEKKGYDVLTATVFETPTNKATYRKA